ncbi:CapA family protein [Pseudarthrobacter sp. R1]|uniref:CapA family protein n=1 Tax=Pseudarthrobacter sp. R1 TaxID=2944934 RepID=UPI00210EDA5A|nr:CapA family protein [Pseudarthrobacter sp. R1]MCQ6271079.1 CapA family protein [Pseudarthrobacter sp. R1]
MHPKTRDRFLMVTALAVSIAGTGAIAVNYGEKRAPEVQSVDVWTGRLPAERWSVQFLGDTMLGDGATPMLDPLGYDAAVAGVLPLIDGDFVIANVESPITSHDQPLNPGKEYSYHAEPQSAWTLSKAGIDAIGLGNNHSMDMGLVGLQETMKLASNAGMASFGAGNNLAEAERPLMLRTDRGTIGVVAIGENFGKASRAEEFNPGTVALSPATVQRGYDLARAAGADWVVAYVHWGDNYVETSSQERYWAQMMVDTGYDLIVGHGPHIADKIEFIGDVPVAYSLGNFVFGTPGRFESYGKQGIGLMLSVEMSRNGPVQLAVKCLVTDNSKTGFVTQPCDGPQMISAIPLVNPALQIQGNVARMPCRCFEPPK